MTQPAMTHTQPDERDYWETSSEEEDEGTPDAAKAIQDKQEASNISSVDGNTSKAPGNAADGSGGDQKADDAEPPKPALPEYSTRPSSAAAAKPSTSSGDVAAPAHDGGSGSPPARKKSDAAQNGGEAAAPDARPQDAAAKAPKRADGKSKRQRRREEAIRKKKEAAERKKMRAKLEAERLAAKKLAEKRAWKAKKKALRRQPRAKRLAEDPHTVYDWNLSCGRWVSAIRVAWCTPGSHCKWSTGIALRTATLPHMHVWLKNATHTATNMTRTSRYCTPRQGTL